VNDVVGSNYIDFSFVWGEDLIALSVHGLGENLIPLFFF